MDAIRRGLEKAIKDGSFNKLFNQYYGESIRRSQIDEHNIIDVDNPLLPLSAPTLRKELWFTLENERGLTK